MTLTDDQLKGLAERLGLLDIFPARGGLHYEGAKWRFEWVDDRTVSGRQSAIKSDGDLLLAILERAAEMDQEAARLNTWVYGDVTDAIGDAIGDGISPLEAAASALLKHPVKP